MRGVYHSVTTIYSIRTFGGVLVINPTPPIPIPTTSNLTVTLASGNATVKLASGSVKVEVK